ncbi:class A beta-lactamase [Sphingomonas morindae]|uniref:beta-lactamase n=1 Tax=Sphingomonas morindae TaxID=1541170 RepID=A0ABY4X8F6_9SPHN|nr:class A beta-lactamase [Sphingomonas morindae]USI73159.1 class A beta-lactamase [Sphingomonas morindae]
MRLIDRRGVAAAMGAGLLLPAGARARAAPPDPGPALRAVERASGGRLGAFLLDTGSGDWAGWRADERFCHCSTFKLSLAALVLREADAGRIGLEETLALSRADLVDPSPVVAAHLAAGRLSIRALAEAAQIMSDNGAANLLLRRLGGPDALTRFWRAIGDRASRLDGYEPAINIIPPGTEQNSTTPRAMAETVRRIVLGDVLRPPSRDLLQGWMAAARSGRDRIRAGLAAGWRGLDKTGTGMRPGIGNKTNDLAVLWPPSGGSAVVVVGYLETPVFSETVRPQDEAVLKRLGAIATAWRA